MGVIGYEFMLGRRPYVGRNRKEIRDMMFSKQVQIKRADLPEGWSIEAADFINKVSRHVFNSIISVLVKKARQQARSEWS